VDKVIPLMAENRLVPYLDIPLQHASLPLLKSMKRPAATEKSLQRIRRWRELCPNLTIRSTFIVGFPGETEQDFEELLDFLEEAQLDRVGCFQYSPVEGAVANRLANPVAEEIKQQRWERFMKTQQAISTARLAEKVGQRIEVLIDTIDDQGISCRSTADAPEIDGSVFLPYSENFQAGQLIDVTVTGSDAYDLYAELATE